MTSPAPASARPTFTLIQALRGIAALWVVLFHIGKGRYVDGLLAQTPGPLRHALFDYGSAGVAIFFVLSGFVIAHSLTNTSIDGRGFGRFVARRALRLDPPYWASMALTLLVGLVFARAKGLPVALPSAGAAAAHLVYMQELLGLPEIAIVYWTLTYEVQFYLVLAAAWWGASALARRGMTEGRARIAVLVPLGALAFVAAAQAREWAMHGLFANLWHGFFLGVLAYEAGVRRRWLPVLAALAAVTLVGAARSDAVFGTPCAVTALLLVLAARTGYLERGLSGRFWQFLGRISYSLYLVHLPLILLGFGIWGRLAGRSAAADTAGLMVVGGGIVAGAACFWWAIERPAHALSARLFARRVDVPAVTRL